MKILKYLFISSLMIVFTVGCEKGIDPITPVSPGTDETAPEVTINYPIEGTLIRVPDAVATINLKVVANDDIELQKVSLQIDGAEVKAYTSFKDYRRAVLEFTFDNVTDGDHIFTVVATDLTGKATTQSVNFKKVAPYTPLSGEVIYMPFDNDYNDLVNFNSATVVGSPGFSAGKVGQAYAGATDAYLTFPVTGLLGSEFSIAFWYKMNASPDRAGMIAICRPYNEYNDTTRFKGFRMAREISGANQNLFANLGIGNSEVWVNPYIATASTDWMHIAVSVSTTVTTIYVDGVQVKEAPMASPINWQGCTSLSIASGAPNFTYWEHFSDLSLYDELRVFNKAISADEVNAIYAGKK